MRPYFIFFVVSGLCGLVYEVVWLRLAMASLGVTAALVSIVLSIFMAGLGLGAWAAGLLMRKKLRSHLVLRLYSLAEFLVALSSVLVPYELKVGRHLLQQLGHLGAWQTSTYYLIAGAWLAFSLIPWCTCMGATFPLLMAVIRQQGPQRQSEHSFSYLYVANVLGALVGTLASAFVSVEVLGFTKTLYVSGVLNLCLATSALILSVRLIPSLQVPRPVPSKIHLKLYELSRGAILAVLFTTGFVSMGMEVVWVRQLTPFLGNVVYAFAGIVAVYLLATLVGAHEYRSWIRSHALEESASMWSLLAFFAVIPLIGADPFVPLRVGGLELGGLRLASILLFCAMAGFLTPLLLDAWSEGDPERAGTAYAVNLVGSILGPLVAGFWLLPWVGERRSLLVLSLPLFVIAALMTFRHTSEIPATKAVSPKAKFTLTTVAAIVIFLASHDYEQKFSVREVRRDYTATVIANGKGFDRGLLINGTGMTYLTPLTKYMAHLPLALLSRPPQNGLVICFGMGTSFRSMLSWGIKTTAVDLVPSVPALFGYFHSDAKALVQSPRARIVVDDGRRFLDGSHEAYDVIVVDPPPPPSAPGSSLLYSREFYEVVKQHLRAGGILQMWYPSDQADFATAASVAKALSDAFPHVRAFSSLKDYGIHFVASMQPLPRLSSSVLASRMPAAAVADLVEWGPESDASTQFERVVSRELPVEKIVALSPKTPALRDDEPINEYYLLRNWFHYYR